MSIQNHSLPSLKPLFRLGFLPVLICSFALAPLHGQPTNWQRLGAGTFDWNDINNWDPIIFPNSIDANANLSTNITGAQIIELNVAITLGTLTLGDTASTFFSQTIAAGTAGSLVFDVATGNASLTRTGGGIAAGDLISAAIQLNDNLGIAVGSGGLLTLSGDISGTSTGLLRSVSGGTVVLSGNNTYTGNNVFSAGTTRLGHASALGTTAGTTTINTGAAVQLDGFTTSENFTLSGGSLTNDGTILAVATVNGDIDLTANSSVGGRTNSAALTIAGNITGSGQLNIINSGTITILNGAATHAGGTLLNSNLTVGTTGSLAGNVSFATTNQAALVFDVPAATTVVFSGNITPVSGNTTEGRFEKQGTGTLELGGNNVIPGRVTLTGGTLDLRSANAITSAGGTPELLMTQNRTSRLNNNSGGAITNDRLLNFQSFTTTFFGGGYDMTFTGGLILSAANNNILNVDANRTLTIEGSIGSNNAGVRKQGAGALVLVGSGSFTQSARVEGGILGAHVLADGGVSSSIGSTSNAAANVLLSNGTTLRYLGAATSTDRLFTLNSSTAGHGATLEASGSGAINFTNTGAIAYGNNNQTRTLTLGGTNTGNNTLAALIQDNGTGAVSLAKSDAGTWQLTGTNTYSGATNVSAGTLIVDGTHSGTGSATVSSGATLGGIGTLAGVTTVDGIIAPGNSIGQFNITNNVIWNGTASNAWKFELGAANSADLLNITGDFLKGGGSAFVFDFANTGQVGTFKLVDWTGMTDFASADFSYTNLGGSNTGTFAFNSSQLDIVVVPEPSTLVIFTGALLALIVFRRSRRKKA